MSLYGACVAGADVLFFFSSSPAELVFLGGIFASLWMWPDGEKAASMKARTMSSFELFELSWL